MKRLCLCIAAALTLASCLQVDDFGAYWDKGFQDPALAGSWKNVGLPDGKDGIDSGTSPAMWRFTKDGAGYLAQPINPIDPSADASTRAQQQQDNSTPMNARSLRIGRRTFLMLRDPSRGDEGVIQRYDIQGTTLKEYWLDNGLALEFLAAKHPSARNIKKNVGEGDYLVIDKFDDEVFKVLSELSANADFWLQTSQYKKVP